MPGFGSGPFGSGPFGQFDWAKQTLYNDIPEIDRQLDTEEGQNNRLFKWSSAVKGVFDELLGFTRSFGDLRDPDTIRTQFQGRITVNLLSASATPDGRVIEAFVDDPDPTDPFNPLGAASVGWILTDSSGREFTVNAVHKLDGRGPVLDLKGSAVEPVTEATSPGNGDAVLRPPALVQLLAADYGINIDRHEPEGFQRSAVRNVVQWLDLKGTAKAYDILGKISGYRVTPLGLWRVDPVPSALPVGRVFELPAGSGKFYTDIDPTRAFFDEVAADTVPLDYYCFETPDWDTEAIVPPGSPGVPVLADDTTVSEAIGFTMQDLFVVNTIDLGDGRWSVTTAPDTGIGDSFTGPVGARMTLNDAAGSFRPNMVGGVITIAGATTPANNGDFLVLEVPSPTEIVYGNAAGVAEAYAGLWSVARHNPIGLLGYWFCEFSGAPGIELYVETFTDLGGGNFQFEVYAGDAPTLGPTVSFDYECRPDVDCEFCRASLIRVEVVPEEVLTDPDALLDGVLTRLIDKILQVVPAHVRLTDIVHLLGPVEATLNITISATASSAIFAYASVGYYYDIVPADVIETDPDHISVSATNFTVP